MFVGAFNKKNNFCDRTWAHDHFGLDYTLDAQLFDKIAAKIVKVIGEKTIYTVQDAYNYFHIEYNAYIIDYRQFYNYCHTDKAKLYDILQPTISDDTDIELLSESSGQFFAYLKNGRFTSEKALTLVIDNSFVGEGSPSRDNLILVIGSFDGTTINSMKVIFNPNCPHIEYALEFFRTHS